MTKNTIYNPWAFTENELLLIFDGGNLCFGGMRIRYGLYEVFED